MNISIIGTGNVATILAKKLFAAKHNILFIYGRNIDSASVLANEVLAKPTHYFEEINNENDIVIVAVKDVAIEDISRKINLQGTILLHTAGSVNKNILGKSSNNYGVLYPIQSLRINMDIETPIPFLIDANNENTFKTIEILAKSISTQVAKGNDEKRLKLHTAAVFACNFVNYMYLQSANFCKENNIDFSLLLPLIEETATRLKSHHPSEVFTGPAVRKDVVTIEKHLQLLQQNPTAYSIYKILSELIMNQ